MVSPLFTAGGGSAREFSAEFGSNPSCSRWAFSSPKFGH
jgi:hypothetical protein